ncbi:hypothetical protein C8R47DRAFT_1148198 [Mycena vitilis]|nr:hypothetical protein C8R47DRAFT_1148198 [Mycena vitilis]
MAKSLSVTRVLLAFLQPSCLLAFFTSPSLLLHVHLSFKPLVYHRIIHCVSIASGRVCRSPRLGTRDSGPRWLSTLLLPPDSLLPRPYFLDPRSSAQRSTNSNDPASSSPPFSSLPHCRPTTGLKFLYILEVACMLAAMGCSWVHIYWL